MILAIDVGTSSVKAALLPWTSGEAARPRIAREPYPLSQPSPGACEIDPEALWHAIGRAVSQVAAGQTVTGVGISCLTPALVLCGADGNPLRPICTHLDRRSRDVARRTWEEVGPAFHEFSGNRPLPGGTSAVSFRALAESEPELPSKVRAYLHLNGWLGYRLTGETVFDPANASFSGLFPTMTGGPWSERWCEYFHVDPRWLPPVVDGATTVGPLRASVAKEWGIPAGIPVKAGTADTSSAMLAVGLRPGELLHVVGTTQVLAAVVDEPEIGERRLVRRLGVGKAFVHVTHNPVGGAALEWLRELCFRDVEKGRFYDELVPLAASRVTTTRLSPAFLGGDRLEIDEADASLRHLTLWTEREDLLAALVTAMRKGHAKALAALGVPGPPGRVHLTGGGAGTVRGLLPDYAAAKVEVFDEGSLRGVARLFVP